MDEMQRNRLVAAGLLTVAILLAGWASFAVMNASHYQKYEVDGDLRSGDICEDYYAACTCYGELHVRESYPEQFDCRGYEVCHDMNRTVCTSR